MGESTQSENRQAAEYCTDLTEQELDQVAGGGSDVPADDTGLLPNDVNPSGIVPPGPDPRTDPPPKV